MMKKLPRVLFVDDEPDFLDTTLKRMARRGYQAKGVPDCESTLRLMEEGWPDVVVLDVMMPGMDGLQCLQQIKKRWQETAVLLLTGHASMKTGADGLEFGAYDYCLKPIELDELIEKITLAWNEANNE